VTAAPSEPVCESDGTVEGVGGLRLQFRVWEPPAPRAAVVIVHGQGEHAGRYAPTAAALAQAGFASYALDLRGHGRSEGRRGHVRAFDHYLQDLDRFRTEVAGLAGADVPLFLLGHSMGGLVALRYLQEFAHPFSGAVISAPWLATVVHVPRWKTLLAPLLARVVPALPFRTGLDASLLSHDAVVVQAYRNDPLVHDVVTPRLFREVSAAMGTAFRQRDRTRAPLLFLLAGDDRIVDTRRSEAFARSLAAEDVTVTIVPGAYHEPLNERDRGAVLGTIRDWLDARC
jgi:lysophospholipase